MERDGGAPRARQLSAPARHTGRYGLAWRARDAWRGLRWRASGRPLYVIGLIWVLLGALMLLGTVLVPGLARHPAGPCVTGTVACVLGTWACCVKGRWSR